MFKKQTKFGVVLLTLIALAMSMQLAFAQKRPQIIPDGAGNLKIPSISNDSKIPQEQYLGGVFLPTITNIVIAVVGSSALIFMIIGAIEILTAYGNDDKIANGKKTITYALVGLVVAMLSYAIITIVSSVQL